MCALTSSWLKERVRLPNNVTVAPNFQLSLQEEKKAPRKNLIVLSTAHPSLQLRKPGQPHVSDDYADEASTVGSKDGARDGGNKTD